MSEPHDKTEEWLKSWVRAALALMFGVSVCYGFLFAKIGGLTLVSSDAFSTIAIAVILWWFNKEMSEQRAKETAAAIAALSSATPPGSTSASTTTTTVTTTPPPTA